MAKSRKDGGEEQPQRFIETARELGCDEDEAAFDEKLKRIVGHRPVRTERGLQTPKRVPRKT